MHHLDTEPLKPEITKPEKASEKTPSTSPGSEVQIALEILLGINEHEDAAETDLIKAARQFHPVLTFITKIFGGSL